MPDRTYANHTRKRGSDGRGPEAVPFGGLGFDLSPVRSLVACLRLAPVRAHRVPNVLAAFTPPQAMQYGYGLMLWLNRETGGS